MKATAKSQQQAKGRPSKKAAPTGNVSTAEEAKKPKAKGTSKAKATSKKQAQDASKTAGKGSKRSIQEKEDLQATPVRKKGPVEPDGLNASSPTPANAGKFLNSARRRAHEKRQAGALQALQNLRRAGLPELVLPDADSFRRQSFTATRAQGGSKIGVILGTNSFYVYHATVPVELQSFVHSDRNGGVSLGMRTFHGPRLAWLGSCIWLTFL